MPKKGRKMPEFEILWELVYEMLVCVARHTLSDFSEWEKIRRTEITKKEFSEL